MAHLTVDESGEDRAVGLADERENSADGFDRLVAEHSERVARLVYRLVGWRGDVDDIVQDVFLAALKGFKGFRDESSQWTWLAAIAINRCRSFRRRRLLEFRWLKSAAANGAAEAESSLERDETCERVRRAVGELGVKDREVIVLYYLEDWPVRRIGEALGVSQDAINVRLHRAREKLRGLLKE